MVQAEFSDMLRQPLHGPLGLKPDVVVSDKEVVPSEHSDDSLAGSRPRLLVVSPYTEEEHLLDLDTLDVENQLLAEALANLRCLRDDYATSPYPETFNWDEVIDQVRGLARSRRHTWKETSFYIVAFRSQIQASTVYADLGILDKAAHAEATASGGFLKYWFGTPNHELRNLATCIWRSREDAKRGGVGPAHRTAAAATRNLYSFWQIDRHRLIIRDSISSWEIVDWLD